MPVAGLLTGIKGYIVLSNREGGKGRSDLPVKPVRRSREVFVVEFKVAQRIGGMDQKADEAIRQIEDRKYDMDLKNDLTMADVRMLYYLSQPHGNCTLKEMGGTLNISRREISAAIQRLAAKELIVRPDKKNRITAKDYTVSQETETILSEVMFALCDLEQIQYEGFSQEEIELYEKLNERRNRMPDLIADSIKLP